MNTNEIIVLSITFLVIFFAVGICLYILVLLYQKKLKNQIDSNEFSERVYHSSQDFQDGNPHKFGKINRVLNFRSYDFIRWEKYFRPQSKENDKQRNKGKKAIIFSICIISGFSLLFGILEWIGMMLFMIILLLYLQLIYLYNFLDRKSVV